MEEGKNTPTETKQDENRENKGSLEEMFQDLEEVISEMEGSDITLEQSFDLYNRGMNLLKQCSKTIDEVEKKVLILDEEGETHEF